jgi:hypothetical protein
VERTCEPHSNREHILKNEFQYSKISIHTFKDAYVVFPPSELAPYSILMVYMISISIGAEISKTSILFLSKRRVVGWYGYH